MKKNTQKNLLAKSQALMVIFFYESNSYKNNYKRNIFKYIPFIDRKFHIYS